MNEVGIGMLDTGVDAGHPSLRGRVRGFLDVDDDGRQAREIQAYDGDGHGTHTAAIICAQAASSASCPARVRLDCARVIEGGKVPLRVLAGIEWLIHRDIRVLHIPLALTSDTALLHLALGRARRRGILPVVAVGNLGSGRCACPGSDRRALSVGACDGHGRVAEFSGSLFDVEQGRCIKPELVAPGVDIRSAQPGRTWARQSGTSMASAYVAGVAARLFAMYPHCRVHEIEAALVRSSRPLRREWAHRCAHGLVDAEAAAQLLARAQAKATPIRALRKPSRATRRCDPLLVRRVEYGVGGPYIQAIVGLARDSDRASSLSGLRAWLESLDKKHAAQLQVQRLADRRHWQISGHANLFRALLRRPEVVLMHATELDSLGWAP